MLNNILKPGKMILKFIIQEFSENIQERKNNQWEFSLWTFVNIGIIIIVTQKQKVNSTKQTLEKEKYSVKSEILGKMVN